LEGIAPDALTGAHAWPVRAAGMKGVISVQVSRAVAVTATAGLLLMSCMGSAEPAGFDQAQQLGEYRATLAIVPYPPVTMQKATLQLTVRDGEGQPIRGAQVWYDLTMPFCEQMPVNRPQAPEHEAGLYVTPAIFTMAGYWRARVTVRGTGVDEEFEFFFKVR
jgi:hypothetical protein